MADTHAAHPAFDALHAPIVPLLRHLLAQLPCGSARVLDIGCGAGAKRPLIETALNPRLLIGLDIDRTAAAGYAPCAITGDAHSLPFADSCIDAICCIATLGLLADPGTALREAYRVLRPGGALIVVTTTHRYAQVTSWPPDLVAALTPLLSDIPANDDIVGDLRATLTDAGFEATLLRAMLLDGAPSASDGALQLHTWAALRPQAAAHLSSAAMARGDAPDAPEVELCSLALGAIAIRPA